MKKTFVSAKDESVRIFKNDLLDKLSRVHYAVPLVIFVPVILYFTYRSIFDFHLPWYEILGFIGLGVLVWTFTEYILHRFVFHWCPPGKIGERIHFISHGVHHDYPNDHFRLVMVPSISIPLAVGFYFLFYLILGPVWVAPYFVGYVAGYLFYDMTHYAVHHANIKSGYFKALKKHHMKHHFQDPDHGYGVSSKLWDFIFRSDYPKKG